ncbi:SDR family oxidoreductase [Aggregicoccus sp. 17bor-14]|uniref:SDR family oxidoreductase n=1 Tax=Myxococcaceae TaxID=31 RepID=UPI00129C67F1|nr:MULTISPECIES: SDR family oxidoreductase [Myxococcaceae]MBF5045002.1 SDR family oxidoreductase [Simulacricoccus sp. 17bor-14]MRI90745.1 SDR family oxidoreductase [Aggregicoccus sp. 17bor-14]
MNLVITGANRGIGLELVRQALARGDRIHAGVREPARAEALTALAEGAQGRLRVGALDVASDASVRAFAAQVQGPVHVLVNNAGLRVRPDALEPLDLDGALQAFQVNALGALRVTGALLPRLREAGSGARVVNLSSSLGSIAGNDSGGAYGYRMSKAALNMATRSLAGDLRPEGLLAVALSPGWVRTDMGGGEAPVGVEESAAGLLAVIDGLCPEQSGRFLDFRGQPLGW